MIQEDSSSIQILLASSHTIFRAGLRSLLHREPDLWVVGEAGEAMEALRLAEETNPDVMLLDGSLRGLSGMKPGGQLRTLFGSAPTLLLSESREHLDPAEALLHGAGGIVLKHSGADLLIKGIRDIANGRYGLGSESVADRNAASLASESPQRSARLNTFGLTDREFEVVQWVVSGYSNKEIGVQLAISDETVKHHLSNIFDKVGSYNRLELALFAIHHGLVSSPASQGAAVQ